ncbi:aquaporin-1-like [Saccostrea echinata]|uniref:aquaporin-1-like n=1 Tax=Saccostrea echinata TaxID=191078 RepID=UPI002A7EB2F4|nr:aquaporin-1-like [Saccostrea echinata]
MEGYFMHVSQAVAEARFGKDLEEKVYSIRELKTWKFWRAVLAEFVGTMLFVFLGCASTLTNPINPVRIALAFGLAIMALIQMFGHISGGHFNPAVSLGLLASFQITIFRALLYTVAQTIGAIVGGMILKGVTPGDFHANLGVTKVSDSYTLLQGVAIELILTFCLVFVIVATTDGNRTDFGSVSLKIGLTVAMLHFSSITLTGSSMNPARSLGSAVASNDYDTHWVYWVGPILGGCIASLLYKFLFSPYRGAISNDEATHKLLAEGNMIAIPRNYFTGTTEATFNGKKLDSSNL